MTHIDFSINPTNMNNLFVEFRRMDVLLKQLRKDSSIMDEDDANHLRTKRWHFHQCMMILGIMDEYLCWCKELGIE